MQIKVDPIEILEVEPFRNDLFNPKKHIEILTGFFESIKDKNFILSLNG